MKNLFLLALISISFYACPSEDDLDDICIAELDPTCLCIDIYDPVCGCDNVTYSNSCMAECSNIFNYTPGPCPE